MRFSYSLFSHLMERSLTLPSVPSLQHQSGLKGLFRHLPQIPKVRRRTGIRTMCGVPRNPFSRLPFANCQGFFCLSLLPFVPTPAPTLLLMSHRKKARDGRSRLKAFVYFVWPSLYKRKGFFLFFLFFLKTFGMTPGTFQSRFGGLPDRRRVLLHPRSTKFKLISPNRLRWRIFFLRHMSRSSSDDKERQQFRLFSFETPLTCMAPSPDPLKASFATLAITPFLEPSSWPDRDRIAA